MRARLRSSWPRQAVRVLALASLASTAPAAEDAGPPPAGELLARAWHNLYDADSTQLLRLTSRLPGGRAVSRRLSIARKYAEPPPRALIRFLEPADIRGTSLLVIERGTRDADVFLYLPAFDRTRRITAAQRFDAFFGTNLTYEDLEPKTARDFEVTALGPERVDGLTCQRLELRPKPGVESQYDRTVSCIEDARAVILWTDYEVKGRALKRLESDPASIRPASGRFLPFRSRLVTHATGFETEIAIDAYEAERDLPDSLFTVPHMELGGEPRPPARDAR